MGGSAGSNETQAGSLIIDHFIEKLGPYISNNVANAGF